jgi:hypothetical protein
VTENIVTGNSIGIAAGGFVGGVTIDSNLIATNTIGIAVGVDASDMSTATATCNRIVSNGTGIVATVAVGSTVTANLNSITGNTIGIDALGVAAGSVAAQSNWWGAADGPSGVGPGSGDSVTFKVTFSPFSASVPGCTFNQIAGLSIRKVTMRGVEPSRGKYRIKGELDTTITPTFLADVDADGLVLRVDSTVAQVNAVTFTGADCTVKNGSLRCQDPVTKSSVKLRKRSSPSFFLLRASIKRQTFIQPTAGETPLLIRIETPTDNVERTDGVGDCVERGTTLKCKEAP